MTAMETMVDPTDPDEHRRYIHMTMNAMCPPRSYPRVLGYENASKGADLAAARKAPFRQDLMSAPFELANRVPNLPPAANKYVSVYGFPDGHPKDGHPPMVDCLWFDFDVDKEGDWAETIEPLLDAMSQVAADLLADHVDRPWRVVLSGYRGIHVYLDFRAISLDVPVPAYKEGLAVAHETVLEQLNDRTVFDLTAFFDKDAHDLARLTRIPNTLHPEASDRFGEARFAVPVDLDELVALTPDGYAELTRRPRLVESWTREQSTFARTHVMAAIERADRNMDPNVTEVQSVESDSHVSVSGARTWYESEWQTADFGRVLDPENRWRFEKWPCLLAWPDRDDQFDLRGDSHNMEMWVMSRLIQYKVPYHRIVEYIEDLNHPKYSYEETTDMLDSLISLGYGINCPAPGHYWIEGGPFVCEACRY